MACNNEIPLECLQSALLRLVTHYAMRPDADRAAAVARVLSELAAHPAAHEVPVLHNACVKALIHWRQLATAKAMKASGARAAVSTVH